MSANSNRIIELFSQAKAKMPGEERERFLTEACSGDAELREQVESLLRAEDSADQFLQKMRPFLAAEAVILITLFAVAFISTQPKRWCAMKPRGRSKEDREQSRWSAVWDWVRAGFN